MCKTSDATFFHCDESFEDLFEDLFVPLRSRRVRMRAVSRRKATAAHRIAINRFWNEMEEFYDRRTERTKVSNLCGKALPAYTTDVWDHAREAAENELNERISLQMDRDVKMEHRQMKIDNAKMRSRLESSDVFTRGEDDDDDSLYSTSPESDVDSDFADDLSNVRSIWNDLTDVARSPMPSPPKALPDLTNFNFDF